MRAELRTLREHEAADVSAFKASAQQTIEEKNHEIHTLRITVDDLLLENNRLRILLKRAQQPQEVTVCTDCLRAKEVTAQQAATIARLQSRVEATQRTTQVDTTAQRYMERQLATYMRNLGARVEELQSLSDNIESSLDKKTLVCSAENLYEDEAASGIDVDATTVGCHPDPVSVGHEVEVVIITRNAEGMPCRGASSADFEISAVGGVADISRVTGARSCFSVTFVPTEVGRCGVVVNYRGHRMSCTTSSVRSSENVDPKQTAIMLSPNPVKVGTRVTGTIITKNAQGVVTRIPNIASFGLHALGNAADLSSLVQCGGSSSQGIFTFLPVMVGRSGVTLSCDGITKTAAVEVVDVTTPAISTMHTVLSCSPNPARVGEEITVILTTRSGAGIPTAGASVEDLRSLRPVGGAAQLHPFETISPSTFRTTFVARKNGSAGIALSFMGLTLYATTAAVSSSDEFDAFKTTMTCSTSDFSVDMPADIIITARDRWGAPFPCRSESMWSLSAENAAIEIMSLTKASCSTLRARIRPLRSGSIPLELMHCSSCVGKMVLEVCPRRSWDPAHTQMMLKKDVGDDAPVSFLLSEEDALSTVSHLDTVQLVVTTRSADGRLAIGPSPESISVLSVDATPVVQVSEGVYVMQIYNFEPGAQDIQLDVDGTILTVTVRVTTAGRMADPRYTQAECRPSAVFVGDTVSTVISFFDAEQCAAEAPDPSHLLLEPIGSISELTRVAPHGPRGATTLEVLYMAEQTGPCGVVVRHGNCSYTCTTTVCSLDSLTSGPCHIAATDVALTPQPVRPGHQVQCYITLRDYRFAPLHNVPVDAINVVLLPLENTAKVSSKVRRVPGTSGTWVTSFTAGLRPGTTGVVVEVNGHRIEATTVVEDDPFGAIDDEIQRLREMTNRLHDDTDRETAAAAETRLRIEDRNEPRVAEDQLHELELARARHVTQNEAKRSARNIFPHFGLEVTDSVKFSNRMGGPGGRVEYLGVKVVAVKGAAQKAGITSDMIITHVTGRPVEFLSDFKFLVRDSEPGVAVNFTARDREGEAREFKVVPDKSGVPSSQRVGYTRRIRVSAVDIDVLADQDGSTPRRSRTPQRRYVGRHMNQIFSF